MGNSLKEQRFNFCLSSETQQQTEDALIFCRVTKDICTARLYSMIFKELKTPSQPHVAPIQLDLLSPIKL